MADVTDIVFRNLVAKYSRHGQPGGGPDVFWTEFVATDGLMSAGREKLLVDLKFTNQEHPIVAQIFGATPQNFEDTARMCIDMGYDGIDINMGCPDKNVCKQGAGSALIKTPELAQEVIRATMRGAGDKPVSVKTRIGWTVDETETWIPAILETNPAVLSIHARTKKDMSKVPPKWEAVKRAVELRNQISPETLIMANGGIRTHQQGREVVALTGCDGIMMGKAVFGNPWLFDTTVDHRAISIRDRLQVMMEHTNNYERELGEYKNFAIMKKHFKAYVHGFPGAKELRMNLMDQSDATGVTAVTKQWITTNPDLASEAPGEEYIA